MDLFQIVPGQIATAYDAYRAGAHDIARTLAEGLTIGTIMVLSAFGTERALRGTQGEHLLERRTQPIELVVQHKTYVHTQGPEPQSYAEGIRDMFRHRRFHQQMRSLPPPLEDQVARQLHEQRFGNA